MALVNNFIRAKKVLSRKEMQRWSLQEIAIPPMRKTIKSNSVERYPRSMKIKNMSWSTHVWTWMCVWINVPSRYHVYSALPNNVMKLPLD